MATDPDGIHYVDPNLYFMYGERERPGSSYFCRSLFLPVSFESLRSTFSCSSMDNFSETWLTIIMQLNCPLQPLTVSSSSKTEQGIQ